MEEITKIKWKNGAEKVLYTSGAVIVAVTTFAIAPAVGCTVSVADLIKKGHFPKKPDQEYRTNNPCWREDYASEKRSARKRNWKIIQDDFHTAYVLPGVIFNEITDLAQKNGKARIKAYEDMVKATKDEIARLEEIQRQMRRDAEFKAAFKAAREDIINANPKIKDKFTKAGLGDLLELIKVAEIKRYQTLSIGDTKFITTTVGNYHITEDGAIYKNTQTQASPHYKRICSIPVELMIYVQAAIELKDEAQYAEQEAARIKFVASEISSELRKAKIK